MLPEPTAGAHDAEGQIQQRLLTFLYGDADHCCDGILPVSLVGLQAPETTVYEDLSSLV